ncbi:MAG: CoA-transferase [Rhodobacterales bacterium]|nr:CoA-transferase [Rhodobacterales bacterium]
MSITRGDYCVIACAEAFRGDGEIMASPMAPVPKLGVGLALRTFEPDLVCTDGVAHLVDVQGKREGWMPYAKVFENLWWGKRHVMMGASQIDQHGNQNISALGPAHKPKVQLRGVRGAPGNTIHHTTSYWVGHHSPRVFVPLVDRISGVGPCNGAHEIRVVVTNLGVFDLCGPKQTMRLQSLHPGATVDQVQERTGFTVFIPDQIGTTRAPTAAELEIIEKLDPEARIRGAIKA